MEVVDTLLLGSQFARFAEALASPLVSPAAKCIPRSAKIFMTAIECPYQAAAVEQPIFEACGLNLSSFNAFRTHDIQLIPLHSLKCQRAISAPTELFAFEFKNNVKIEESESQIDLIATEEATWHAVAIWYEATLDDSGTVVTNDADQAAPGTLQAILFLPKPVTVSPGDKMPCLASQDLHNLRVSFPGLSETAEKDESLQVSSVSRWHWGMMHDERRNAVYNDAICRALKKAGPDIRCMDIGSGSGLLAMMLARGGAKQIHTIESVKAISMMARKITSDNGYGNEIEVLNMMSTEVVIGEEMKEKANLCVSEIVDVGLLGEFCLPTMQHAKEELLTEGAIVIPCAASVYACLVEVARRPHALRRALSGDEVEKAANGGFDLTGFNTFASETYEQLNLNSLEHKRLTAPFKVFDFDLRGGQELERERIASLTVTQGGQCHGVCFWFDLHLDEESHFSTAPEEDTCWNQALFFFPGNGQELSQGAQIEMKVGHEANRVYFEPPTCP